MRYKLRNMPGFRKYQNPLEPLPKGVENGSRCARLTMEPDTQRTMDIGACILRTKPSGTGPELTAITWGLNMTREELGLNTDGFTTCCRMYVFIGTGTRIQSGVPTNVDLFERRL